MKSYSEYKESGVEFINIVPFHWQMKRLKHVAESIRNGSTTAQVFSGETNYPVTRIETISTGEINYDKVGYVKYWGGVENYRLRLGDILLSHINSLAILGNCAMLKDSACLYHGMNLLKIRPNSSVDNKFLLYWLKSSPANQLIKSYAKFAIGQVSVSITNLKEISVGYPPLIEQTQIADFLDRKTEQIDELIRIKERKIELLREQRTALINQAVTKGLHPNVEMKPSGVEWIGEIPVHWEIEKIKHIATIVNEKSTPESDAIKISPENVESETGKVLDFYSSYDAVGVIFQVGDVLFNKLRVYLSKVVFAERSGYSLGEMIVIRPSLQCAGKFIFYLMLSCRFIEHCNSISYGAKMPRTDINDILNAQIPTPTYQEQTQIVKFLDCKTQQIDKLVSEEQQKIELLKEYRQSIISDAVTGKIDVRNEV